VLGWLVVVVEVVVGDCIFWWVGSLAHVEGMLGWELEFPALGLGG